MSEGIKVSEAGVDVSRAADFQLALSTEWPTLKIVKEGTIDVNADGSNSITITSHGLGYAPVFMILDNGVAFTETGPGTSEFDGTPNFHSTKDNLIYNPSVATHYRGYYFIFDYDLGKVFAAPSDHATPQNSTTVSIGMKAAGRSKNIESTDGRDYTVNTDYRPWTVHLSGTTQATSDGFRLDHNLGYVPGALLFSVDSDGNLTPLQARATANAVSITFRGVQAPLTGTVAYVVLKDPIFIGA